MPSKKRQILATCALPYANGSLHLGHMVEHVQADIWVRFQKMQGHECFFICGSDAHGTPIMLSAQKAGINPEDLYNTYHNEHKRDLADFAIDFDNFYTTHSPENKQLAELIYQRLKDNGDIESRVITQAFDPEQNIFLPDRYVKGECPRCGQADQYGDNCEHCGATYSPTDLKNPVSVLSGVAPIQKESQHFFFKLEKYAEQLKEWGRGGHLQTQVANKLAEWFAAGLHPWDISRDEPYFGFEIPGEPGKYFYVWLDAPIGYMASFKNFCDAQSDIDFHDYWDKDSKAELYHFVGKDVMYFHALFWPAMLTGSGFRLPNQVIVHGFLTIDGYKMSKSRGTFIKARDYLEHLDMEYLRYYYAAKLNSHIDDIDLNLEDFQLRVNADLVGKVVNIASRCARFINKKYNNQLADAVSEPALFKTFVDAGNDIASLFDKRELSHAVRDIMALADKANQYIDEKKPWVLAKQDGQADEVQLICSMGLNLFRLLIIYLKPILPHLAAQVETFLNIPPLDWASRKQALTNHTINTFTPLMQRIDSNKVLAMKETASHAQTSAADNDAQLGAC